MGMTAEDSKPRLFNTPLEAGVRAVAILECFAPKSLDITSLSLLDYYVVHTAYAGGPPNIHPDMEARAGEYFVRRSKPRTGSGLTTTTAPTWA